MKVKYKGLEIISIFVPIIGKPKEVLHIRIRGGKKGLKIYPYNIYGFRNALREYLINTEV